MGKTDPPRRLSSRTRHQPERYGVRVDDDPVNDAFSPTTQLNQNTYSRMNLHGRTGNGHLQTSSSQLHPSVSKVQPHRHLLQTSHTQSLVSGNYSQSNIRSAQAANLLPIDMPAVPRSMPVIPFGRVPVASSSSSSTRNATQSCDFPMVSMNNYTVIEVLSPLLSLRIQPFRTIKIPHLNSNCKVFLRVCNSDSLKVRQLDCLPKSFFIQINSDSISVRTKYSGVPYDITKLVNTRKPNLIRVTLAAGSNENYLFAVVMAQKNDMDQMCKTISTRVQDQLVSIEMAREILSNDDILCDTSNSIKISLLCPFSASLISCPVRSKQCKHLQCFDLKSFIQMNELSPKWRCPHCRTYIELNELVVDGYFLRILKLATSDCKEVVVYPTGRFELDRPTPTIQRNDFVVKRESVTPPSDGPPPKKAKPEIECIVLSDSDDDDDDNDDDDDDDETTSKSKSPAKDDSSPTATNSTSATSIQTQDNDTDSDEVQIVFEKLPDSTRNTSKNLPHSNKHHSNNNSHNHNHRSARRNGMSHSHHSNSNTLPRQSSPEPNPTKSTSNMYSRSLSSQCSYTQSAMPDNSLSVNTTNCDVAVSSPYSNGAGSASDPIPMLTTYPSFSTNNWKAPVNNSHSPTLTRPMPPTIPPMPSIPISQSSTVNQYNRYPNYYQQYFAQMRQGFNPNMMRHQHSPQYPFQFDKHNPVPLSNNTPSYSMPNFRAVGPIFHPTNPMHSNGFRPFQALSDSSQSHQMGQMYNNHNQYNVGPSRNYPSPSPPGDNTSQHGQED